MPLPFIVPALVAASGLYGAGRGTKAAFDSSEAKDINSRAKRIVTKSENELEDLRECTNQTLQMLGAKKIEALAKELKGFVETYSRLSAVELSDRKIDLNSSVTDEMTSPQTIAHNCRFLVEGSQGLAAGAMGGSLTAFGAYGGTMMLATSGTGTAISALSGAAATNASLAWLGGGAIASGGLGVAGGTMVLGTLVAGPAMLIFGSVFGAKATQSLNDAKSNLELAEAFKAQTDLTCAKLSGIYSLSLLALNTLSKVRGRLRRATRTMQKIQEEAGCTYAEYTEEQQEKVLIAVKYAELISTLIDTPILDSDGNIEHDSEEQLALIKVETS